MPVHTDKKNLKKGEVTVYLSLIFILLMTFAASMIESASIQTAKNIRRADTNRAMESVFAEYQKELLEEYDIFALEGSYETGLYSEEQIVDRLNYYGAGNMEHSIARIQFLTDRGGESFAWQVEAYMKHKYGITAMEDMLGASSMWSQQEKEAIQYTKEDEQAGRELDRILEENEAKLPEEGNPMPHVERMKQSPILSLAAPKEFQLSQKSVDLANLSSHRERNKGYGDFSDVEGTTGRLSKLLLGEYNLEHFSSAIDTERTGPLDYELEYILSGKGSDQENLEAVAKKLMLLRYVPNYIYLQSDTELKAQAEALSLTLCTVLAVPAVTQAVTQALLAAWAFGETVMDIRSLLKGNRVLAVKTRESWQLQLSNLSKLGTKEDNSDGMDAESGLTYKEYLRMLLFLEDHNKIRVRTIDLIEQNLRKEKGLAFFKADQCISRLEVKSACHLRRGVTYKFKTYFGYR